MVADVLWAFQVSQGSVETLFSEVENVYIIFKQIYSGNGASEFRTVHQNCQSFIEDITKNILVSFFWTYCTSYLAACPSYFAVLIKFPALSSQ